MRIDKDFMMFAGHPEWYTFVRYVGYVPTKEAPKEIAEAMERYNKRKKEREEQGYND